MFGSPTNRDDETVGRVGPPVAAPAAHRPAPFAAEVDSDMDSLVAHVERVMAARPVRARPCPDVAELAAHSPRAESPVHRVSPVATPTPDDQGTVTDIRHVLRCASCGWAIECLADDAERFTRAGCIMCGGPVTPQLADADPPAGSADAVWNKRRGLRHRPRGATAVEVWRGPPGTGRNLATALADVCEEGVGVWLRAAVRPGEEVEVVLTRRDGPPVRVVAEVRWCAQGGDWTYRAGLRLRRPLAYQDLAELTV